MISHNLKTTEANLMKLHRKIKHYHKVYHIQVLGSHSQGQGCNRVKVKKSCLKLCLGHNLKTTEANLMKLKRKIKHNQKVCCAQVLGTHAEGQGSYRVQGKKSCLKLCLSHNLKTTEANLMKLHRKMKHNQKGAQMLSFNKLQ